MNSLSKAKNFVADAFIVAPVTPFVPENIKLAYLPSAGLLRLRLTATGTSESELKKAIKKELEGLYARQSRRQDAPRHLRPR